MVRHSLHTGSVECRLWQYGHRTLVFVSDDALLPAEEIVLHRPSEVLREHGGTTPKYDLLHALRMEQLLRGLQTIADALRAVHRHGVICTELAIGVQQIVRNPCDNRGQTLRPAGTVSEDEVLSANAGKCERTAAISRMCSDIAMKNVAVG